MRLGWKKGASMSSFEDIYENEKSEMLENGFCSIANDLCPYFAASCATCGLHIEFVRTKEAISRMYERMEEE